MKINSLIIIAEEERNLENPERAIEAAKLPVPIYFDDTIKIDSAIVLAYDGNKKIIKANIDGNDEKHSYFTLSDMQEVEPDEIISDKKPKSRPSTKEEIELIITYLKSKHNNSLFLGFNEEDGDFTTYILGENNLLVIINIVFVQHYKNDTPKLFTSQEKYYIKYGIVYPIDNDTEIDDLDEDITEITNII